MRISLTEAFSLLSQGQVVAVPTETVYGLAAVYTHVSAVEKIFELKGRPANNPLIIHLAHLEQLSLFVEQLEPDIEQLAAAFWPGPLTLVLPIKENTIPGKIRAHLPTAAFRIPMHPMARELIAKTGPLVMPSANLSGKPSATMPEHVEQDFGLSLPLLDGGACERGLESTILIKKAGQWCVIRQGALAAERFTAILGYPLAIEGIESSITPLCPGQLYRHYAPQAHLHLCTTFHQDLNGIVLGYEGRTYPKGLRVISLGHLNQAEEVAHQLYRVLRELDENKVRDVWVDVNFPKQGLWLTIAERLQKASKKATDCS